MEGEMTTAFRLRTLPPDLHAAVREAYLLGGNQGEKRASIRMRKRRWVCDAERA